MKKSLSLLLVIGIVVAANLLVQPFLLRLDFTQGKQYTLSKATRNILKSLDEQVTVTAYFSGNLPPDIGKVKRDFQNLLVEFAAVSKGKLDYEFIEPSSDQQKQEAANLGIRPVMINVREKDQVKQQQAFLGAAIKKGDSREVIPFVEPGTSMEYNLASGIKKLSIQQKPVVAFITGHGEPALNELSQVVQELSALYDVRPLDLSLTPAIADSTKVLVWLAPKDSIPTEHFQAVDAFLAQGGSMVVGINRVEVNLQYAMATSNETGMEAWLQSKGILIDTSLVVDVQCGAVTVPQYLGMIQLQTQIKFPYLPLVNAFANHPTVQGLEQVLFPYVSPLQYIGTPQSNVQFTPLVFSSVKSGIQAAPLMLQVTEKKWVEADFPLKNLVLGGLLAGTLIPGGSDQARMIVFGDGDFPVSGQQGRAMTDDNVRLLVNSVDWLGDDSGLMELRSRGVASRPLKAEYLLEESNGKRQFIKWFNVLFPVALVVLGGVLIQQRNARTRRRRMDESFQ